MNTIAGIRTGERPILYSTFDCSSCAALCCRSVVLPLTPPERVFMEAGGSELELLPKPEKRRLLPLVGVRYAPANAAQDYAMREACGYLQQNNDGGQLCGVHDDPQRPSACAELEPGDFRCRVLRVEAGIDSPEAFAQYNAVSTRQA